VRTCAGGVDDVTTVITGGTKNRNQSDGAFPLVTGSWYPGKRM